MKYLMILAVAAAASAAHLEKVYLPPHARSSSGASAGLQAPFTSPGSTQSQKYQQSNQNYQQQSYSQGQEYQNQNHQGQDYQTQNLQGQDYQSQNSQSQEYQKLQAQNQAEILRYENEITDEGFHYAYETSDGTKAEQEGRVIPGAKPEEGSLQVSGSYSYIGDDGQTYSITYTADENGFQPQGAHLPTPPPIPEAILKSLQLTAGTEAQYNSGKTSYDADSNGY